MGLAFDELAVASGLLAHRRYLSKQRRALANR
jgi:hypothetical protein